MLRSSYGATRPLRIGWFTNTSADFMVPLRILVWMNLIASRAFFSFAGFDASWPFSRQSNCRSKSRSTPASSRQSSKNTVACSAPGTFHSMPCHSSSCGNFLAARLMSAAVASTECASCDVWPWSVMTSQSVPCLSAPRICCSIVYMPSYEYCVCVWWSPESQW